MPGASRVKCRNRESLAAPRRWPVWQAERLPADLKERGLLARHGSPRRGWRKVLLRGRRGHRQELSAESAEGDRFAVNDAERRIYIQPNLRMDMNASRFGLLWSVLRV